jgi:tetratricopeptide (TPR) repeat protein
MPVVFHVLVRFGKWQAVLVEPAFDPSLRSSNAVRRYARGVSRAALGRLDEAEAEREALARAIADMDERPIGNNPAKVVLQVPLKVLEGELLFRRGRRDEGLAALREAVRLEDALLYDEPPDWMQPARHTLAATLLAADRPAEAEQAAREDLARFPDNVWSLTGLTRALRAQGEDAQAQAVEARLTKLARRADTEISSPCLCQPGD